MIDVLPYIYVVVRGHRFIKVRCLYSLDDLDYFFKFMSDLCCSFEGRSRGD